MKYEPFATYSPLWVTWIQKFESHSLITIPVDSSPIPINPIPQRVITSTIERKKNRIVHCMILWSGTAIELQMKFYFGGTEFENGTLAIQRQQKKSYNQLPRAWSKRQCLKPWPRPARGGEVRWQCPFSLSFSCSLLSYGSCSSFSVPRLFGACDRWTASTGAARFMVYARVGKNRKSLWHYYRFEIIIKLSGFGL